MTELETQILQAVADNKNSVALGRLYLAIGVNRQSSLLQVYVAMDRLTENDYLIDWCGEISLTDKGRAALQE